MLEGYPFIFQMNDRSYSDELLEYTMQYRFKSSKSNHTYIVRVERYKEHTYCVKFFDKALDRGTGELFRQENRSTF